MTFLKILKRTASHSVCALTVISTGDGSQLVPTTVTCLGTSVTNGGVIHAKHMRHNESYSGGQTPFGLGPSQEIAVSLGTIRLAQTKVLRERAVQRIRTLSVGAHLTIIVFQADMPKRSLIGEVLYAPKKWKADTHLRYLDYDLVSRGLASVDLSKGAQTRLGKPAFDELFAAERKAKRLRIGLWSR